MEVWREVEERRGRKKGTGRVMERREGETGGSEKRRNTILLSLLTI